MYIPQCYDAIRQFEKRDRRESAAAARRSHCLCCNEPIRTETVLDLRNLGIAGLVCQRCVDRHIRYEEEWIGGDT